MYSVVEGVGVGSNTDRNKISDKTCDRNETPVGRVSGYTRVTSPLSGRRSIGPKDLTGSRLLSRIRLCEY